MSHPRCLLILLLLAAAPCAVAGEVRPGDQVRLIEREQHIPAHPGPGDSRIHLRFVSGSEATALQVNAATGWIEVRGDPLQGTANTGWITPRYLAGQPNGGEPVPDTLAWCPPKGSPTPHPSGRLRLATWNLENLHAQDGQSTYTGADPSVTRVATDYDRIRCYVRLFDPDILAVQEVDGEEALSRVVDTEVYDVHVDDRPKGSLNGQQNTGFAFRRGLTVQRQPDFEALDIHGDGSLRYGARIDLTHNGQTLQLLAVHLKSGCFDNATTSSACTTHLAQVPVLGGWIDAAAEGSTPFIVLGNFNRRFNVPHDQVWADLDDGEPANADLSSHGPPSISWTHLEPPHSRRAAGGIPAHPRDVCQTRGWHSDPSPWRPLCNALSPPGVFRLAKCQRKRLRRVHGYRRRR